MRTNSIVCELKPYIQPFERTLALKELAIVSGSNPRQQTAGDGCLFVVQPGRPLKEIVDVLTYWQSVWDQSNSQHVFHTTQILIEAAHVSTKRQRQDIDQLVLPNKRELRYGPHGIHEYRGKFFPQLVGALLNIARCPQGGIVLDPMCGSGTTVVEAAIRGCNAIGIDMNPLSVLLSNAKANSIHLSGTQLKRAKNALLKRIAVSNSNSSWISTLSNVDRTYLSSWFSNASLKELDILATAIYQERNQAIRDIQLIVLSNILRRASFQKVDDLRVRRKSANESPEPVFDTFLAELNKTFSTLSGFSTTLPSVRLLGNGTAIEGDARRISDAIANHVGKVDVIITSPPYATALPYLDTDRLSLSFLDLLPRDEHRERDFNMIGNRELTKSLATTYWDSYNLEKDTLPKGVRNLIDHLKKVNSAPGVGFRRRNLPYLLSKYFLDMRDVIQEMYTVLKPGGHAFIVIGNNTTMAGGKRKDIRTDMWLGEIAQAVGFQLTETLPMDMLVSRDIFRDNAIAKESILFLYKK